MQRSDSALRNIARAGTGRKKRSREVLGIYTERRKKGAAAALKSISSEFGAKNRSGLSRRRKNEVTKSRAAIYRLYIYMHRAAVVYT